MDTIGGIALALGALFVLLAGVGVVRMPEACAAPCVHSIQRFLNSGYFSTSARDGR